MRPLLPAVLAVLLAAGLGGCERAHQPTPAEHVARAKAYTDQGRYREAAIELKNALRAQPDNAEARWLLGRLYLEVSDGASAEKELLRARELGVQPQAVALPLARAYLLQGEPEKALAALREARPRGPRQEALAAALAVEALVGAGRLEEAAARLEEALKAHPRSGRLQLAAARLALARRDRPHALKQARQAVALDPSLGQAWLLLGDLLRDTGRPQEALKAYDQAVAKSFDDRLALLHRAEVRLG
ncbi:MAG: tetratricopeptide repeat protein, partial [Gammaproteobacteria bacterium]